MLILMFVSPANVRMEVAYGEKNREESGMKVKLISSLPKYLFI